MQTERDSLTAQMQANREALGGRSAAKEINAPLKHRAIVLDYAISIARFERDEFRSAAIDEVRGAAQSGIHTAQAAEALEMLGL
jgi:hypothetical protein